MARAALVACLALGAAGMRGDPSEIIIFNKVTDAGKAHPPPTTQKPASYLLYLAGYREGGTFMGGEAEKAPPVAKVRGVILDALSSQHYRSVTRSTRTPPELLIVAHWGYSGASDDASDPDSDPVSFSGADPQALVGGEKVDKLELTSIKRAELMDAAHEDRFFVVLSVYDFAAYTAKDPRKRSKILLWQSRMSVPMNRTSLAGVLPILIRQAAPHFGHETDEPLQIRVDSIPRGTVDVGPVTEVNDQPDGRDTPAPSSPTPAPAAPVKVKETRPNP